MSDVNMDVMTNQGSQGPVANLLTNGGKLDPGAMRPYIADDGRAYMTTYIGGDPKKPDNYRTSPVTNGVLRRDEWKHLDESVLRVAESRLNGVQDLVDKGLVYNLGNAMGTTVLESHDVSDAIEADLTMDGITRSKGDRVDFGTNYLPIPIIHADYEINARVLNASRTQGNALDTTLADRASRKVAEKLENMLFAQQTYAFGNGTIYSYINYPDRNQVTLSDNWDAAGVTGSDIIKDVLDMKQASIDSHHYGPWVLYVPTEYETKLDEDYDDTRGNTIRERILAIAGIDGIKVIDTLPANNVALVQMTSDVVRLVKGLGIQNVEWQAEGNFITKYKVLTIQVPQIRSDYNNTCGIVHLA